MTRDSSHEHQLEEGLLSGTRKPSKSFIKRHWKKMAGGLVVLLALVALLSSGHATTALKPTTPTFPIAETEQKEWAAYSPYFALGTYESPPSNCEITQVREPLI